MKAIRETHFPCGCNVIEYEKGGGEAKICKKHTGKIQLIKTILNFYWASGLDSAKDFLDRMNPNR